MINEIRALIAEWLLSAAFSVAPETEKRIMARVFPEYFRLAGLLNQGDECDE